MRCPTRAPHGLASLCFAGSSSASARNGFQLASCAPLPVKTPVLVGLRSLWYRDICGWRGCRDPGCLVCCCQVEDHDVHHMLRWPTPHCAVFVTELHSLEPAIRWFCCLQLAVVRKFFFLQAKQHHTVSHIIFSGRAAFVSRRWTSLNLASSASRYHDIVKPVAVAEQRKTRKPN